MENAKATEALSLNLRPGEHIVEAMAYRVETPKPPKWQFWRSELVKYNVSAMTNQGRFFVIDPDKMTAYISVDNVKHI